MATNNPAAEQPPQSGFSSMPTLIRWLLFGHVRQAISMARHVRKLLNHQRDILAPQGVESIQAAIRSVQDAVRQGVDKAALHGQIEALENTAGKWLKPYPSAVWRENVEVLLVALSVAMGIRTFFLQPFKIPTGSMQPTLYGVTSKNLINTPDFHIPSGLERVRQWFEGISYVHVVAQEDGEVKRVDPPVRFLIFNIKQTLWFGDAQSEKAYTMWFPPDYGGPRLEDPPRAGPLLGKYFHKGEDIIKLQVTAGDHLFVDRVSYNFCPPKRGDIVVFSTKGIPEQRRQSVYPPIPPDQFYIKRLCGLGGETLVLDQDYVATGVPGGGSVPVGHIVASGKPVSASTPHFQNVYSFYGTSSASKTIPYVENHYYGHALIGALAPGNKFQVEDHHYFVMGDNTMNSSDSRYWGDFPESEVIGKSFFVYWPITDRFGWGYHR
jgi:signal peptidase I